MNFTLVFSAILLVLSNAGVYYGHFRNFACVFCGIGLLLSLLVGAVPLGLLCLFLVIGLATRTFCARRWWRFPAFSGVAVLVALGIALVMTQSEQRRVAGLREAFPYQPMGELPAPVDAFPGGPLLADSELRLSGLEVKIPGGGWISRSITLQRIHEQNVDLFVRSPGLGSVRMVRLPLGELPDTLRPDDLHVPQPNGGSSRRHAETTSEMRPLKWEFYSLHREGILDFINAENFGHVKDRRHVAGFQSHRFSKVPEPTDGWRVETLELVGLLLHAEPRVYVSAELPRMDQLRTAPTRPLDRFEVAGLEQLRCDEDLVAADAPGGMRLLGAIRNAKQCIQCHDGKRGDLLGAFTYTLVKGR